MLSRVSRAKPLGVRMIHAKAFKKTNTEDVVLRATKIESTANDMPNMIWLPDIVEPASNFENFFAGSSKIRKLRNVWLLDHRNQGLSDHHESYRMEELADDIIRFMDENQITMATIGGHGFGAKVATATASLNLERFTGVMCLEGGPVDNRYHEAWHELSDNIKALAKIDITNMQKKDVEKAIDQHVADPDWNRIFKQTIAGEREHSWEWNVDALNQNVNKHVPEIPMWSERYGLWPGRVWAQFSAYSRWIHLSTNTLPFYNVFPRIQDRFSSPEFNIHGFDESSSNHWPHEAKDPREVKFLEGKMERFLRHKDGVDVLLADRSETGVFFVPERGYDVRTGTR